MSENAAYESDMRRWAIDIWANRVRTIFVDGGCVDQGVSKTALQQKGLRKCMHWYVSCLFCRRTKQHVSRCMLTRTELFDASFASAFRPWTRIYPLWRDSFRLGSLFVLAGLAREGGPGGPFRCRLWGASGGVFWGTLRACFWPYVRYSVFIFYLHSLT